MTILNNKSIVNVQSFKGGMATTDQGAIQYEDKGTEYFFEMSRATRGTINWGLFTLALNFYEQTTKQLN